MTEERLKEIKNCIDLQRAYPILHDDGHLIEQKLELYNEVVRLREKLNQRNIAGIQVVVSGETYNEYKGTLQDQISELENRIDKAIEYIENYFKEYYISNYDENEIERELLSNLLNILRGNDE